MSGAEFKPEQDNAQPSVQAQASPVYNNKTLMNFSQPSSSTRLITEIITIPTAGIHASTIPSQSSALDQDHGPQKAPYATPMVVSEAHRYHLASWTVLAVIVTLVLI
jgi:hypothetical protein